MGNYTGMMRAIKFARDKICTSQKTSMKYSRWLENYYENNSLKIIESYNNRCKYIQVNKNCVTLLQLTLEAQIYT